MAAEGQDAVEDETFASLRTPLDKRITKAVMKCGFVRPTLVQKRTLPLALEGKDLLVRARTGSGKTLAYLIPVLQKILSAKQQGDARDAIRAIILVPTRELVAQVQNQLNDLMYFCRDVVRAVALSAEKTSVQETWLRALPDIVIATPGRLSAHLTKSKKDGAFNLRTTVETVVVDEADLIFSFGYADDVGIIVGQLPNTCQSFLMSATLNADVQALKKLVLHNAVTVKLNEASTDGKLAQWFVESKQSDRDVLLFALLRLELISGKKLFFVNSLHNCYHLKLLLEQFHVKAAVLNAELPMNTRLHILEQFNRGVFDNLICTDNSMQIVAPQDNEQDSEDEEDSEDNDDSEEDDDIENDEESEDEDEGKQSKAKAAATSDSDNEQETSKRRKRKRAEVEVEADDEFGVARGVDFQGVSVVVNIDMPPSLQAYTHRIGRTARGGAGGMALTIVDAEDPSQMALLEEIQASQPKVDDQLQPAPLALDVSEINGFRYRVEDVSRAVTKQAIQEARVREVKREMLNSEKLKAHFEDNPTERALLQHDAFRASKVHKHLKHIPDYLIPGMGASGSQPARSTRAAIKLVPGQAPLSEDRTVLQQFGKSTSGRQRWKEKNRVGEYRSKNSKLARQARAKRAKISSGRGRNKFANNPLF
ncbi:ATP-dependent RNA helicase dbp9 [Hondaea fermentalgiana]|uniref:RNA helicase n=1 Tax=Hondaea fermentalgiana TaxID=2315210 RepID=A0A2R5H0A4_9STRA|nr:ATP-dependent RNA helicase dbp9 [Hondaea fermentalgiana]|eukprot:GBG34483.1 ATP-dependent RNA helicase dbp9 [Hondaea fermentalgiana]